jgi:hypothetical protein
MHFRNDSYNYWVLVEAIISRIGGAHSKWRCANVYRTIDVSANAENWNDVASELSAIHNWKLNETFMYRIS